MKQRNMKTTAPLEPEIKGHIVFDQVSFKFEDDNQLFIKEKIFHLKLNQVKLHL